MSKKNLALLLVIIPIVLIATGCLPKCQPEDYASFDIILNGPANGSTLIPPGPPTFSWHHNEDCRPESFSLTITRAEDKSHIFYYTSGKNDSLLMDGLLESLLKPGISRRKDSAPKQNWSHLSC